jgi:MSHA biogenesis protein MshN
VVKETPPRDPVEEAWREAGQALEQGRARDARGQLLQVLKLAPGHAAARQTLITLLIEAGERGEALRLLAEGRALYPTDPWYPRSQAQLHLQAGQPALAAATLKPALTAASSMDDWALYAGIAAKLGQHDEAASALRSALRGNPAQGTWWIGLGVALERQGQKAEALQAFQRALQTRLPLELREFAEAKAAGAP